MALLMLLCTKNNLYLCHQLKGHIALSQTLLAQPSQSYQKPDNLQKSPENYLSIYSTPTDVITRVSV